MLSWPLEKSRFFLTARIWVECGILSGKRGEIPDDLFGFAVAYLNSKSLWSHLEVIRFSSETN